MKFKSFLKEMEGVPEQDPNVPNVLADIKKIINTMDAEELDNFGSWLYTSIYDENYNSDDYVEFDLDEVIEMVTSLDSEDLEYVYDSLLNAEELDDDDVSYMGAGHTEKSYDDDDYDEDENITEKKFFQKKKVVLNREKKQNRVQRRKDKKIRRKEYRKHKAVIKRKQAKYRRKVKRNPNIVRRHR